MLGEQALEALLGGAGDDLGDGVAVLVGVLGEQAGEVAFEAAGALAAGEVDAERFQELGQFRQRLRGCLQDSHDGVPPPILCRSSHPTKQYYHHNANTHWAFPTSRETDEAIADARQVLADFLNASPQEVAFGANMTTLTFHLATGAWAAAGGRATRSSSPNWTTTPTSIPGGPWSGSGASRSGSPGWSPRPARLDLEDLERQITGRTRLVAIGAASNALGTINDVTEVARLAHDAGALVFVDAVHYAPHRLVDVEALGCDFLACSAYKFYGPHVGVLYGRKELLQSLDVPKLKPSPDTAPERLETGTQNHEGIVGAAAAVEFLASLAEGPTRRARLRAAFDELHRRGQALTERLWAGLAEVDGVIVYGPPPSRPRTPTVSFAVDGLPSEEVARRLSDRGLFVSHGDFYATTAVERLGRSREGLVRIGCACYTTAEEIERLLDGVREVAGR